jgi:hypothetical protein
VNAYGVEAEQVKREYVAEALFMGHDKILDGGRTKKFDDQIFVESSPAYYNLSGRPYTTQSYLIIRST